MKFKRILSSALTVVMIFTILVAALPVGVSAAYSSSSASTSATVPEGTVEANLNEAQLKEYLTTETNNTDSNAYINYNYETAEEMLSYELTKGYLYCTSSKDGAYTIYINKYTGFLYYVNNITGQIITSNPTNPGYLTSGGNIAIERTLRYELMSQVTISFFESVNSLNTYVYNSYEQAAVRNQISVTPIPGGLRVNYTLGDTLARFLLPGHITVERFMESFFMPMAEKYEALLNEYCGDLAPDENFSFFENEDYIPYDENGFLNTSIMKKQAGFQYYISETAKLYSKLLPKGSSEYKELSRLGNDIIQLFQYYKLKAPANAPTESALNDMYRDYPITKEGVSIYALIINEDDDKIRNDLKNYVSKIIKTHCPDYTYAMMYKDEADCLYVDNSGKKPLFRCAIEYTLNEDGSLSVRVPSNSITFDDTYYTLDKITPLKFFGAGDMTSDGYVFYPDGSGSVIEFEDFYNPTSNKQTTLIVSSDVYGTDYCYSKITGAYREPITMPVFGVVNEVKANTLSAAISGNDTVTNGYFAILEEGSALALLGYESGGGKHKYISAFAEYTPYPSDEYDLSETISVGSLGKYTIVSESKYSGSYVTRYVMLTDETVGEKTFGKDAYYESSYVGMAAYYRNYLVETGVLSKLQNLTLDLPLYLEVFGSMDVLSRFLTFPITKSIPLTKFSDIEEIYSQLSGATSYITELVEKYKALADAETDDVQKLQYEKTVERYESLLGQIVDIKNINFRLTGFTNGGMNSTYPVKVKWQRSCGGRSGFKSLVSTANKVSAENDANFGIYPEFDFMYINSTAAFDGISNRGTVSRMVDNRYASKQVYDAIKQEYEKVFTLVISPDVLNKHYSKFLKKYSKYKVDGISVSTLGSDINSNFDEENPINREQAKDYVSKVLNRMANENGYDVMIDTGNIYAVKYASHILNISTDSSHLRYASYTVPFIGLVLHSYVNYTGSPINYSGNPDYDLLRSIENGASLYYIVCCRNTAKLKDDEKLSQYYGVDYVNWFDKILTTYKELNSLIGGLQEYTISDHEILIAERVAEDKEREQNNVALKNEFIELLRDQLTKAVDAKFDELQAEGAVNYGKKIKLVVNRDALIAQFASIINMEVAELDAGDFKTQLDKVITDYTTEFAGDADASKNVEISFSAIEYVSKYSYITDSFAQDKNYVYTKYTIDNGNVTMVTYKNGDKEVKFILNYNLFPVTVRLDAETEYTIPAYKYQSIGGASNG